MTAKPDTSQLLINSSPTGDIKHSEILKGEFGG